MNITQAWPSVINACQSELCQAEINHCKLKISNNELNSQHTTKMQYRFTAQYTQSNLLKLTVLIIYLCDCWHSLCAETQVVKSVHFTEKAFIYRVVLWEPSPSRKIRQFETDVLKHRRVSYPRTSLRITLGRMGHREMDPTEKSGSKALRAQDRRYLPPSWPLQCYIFKKVAGRSWLLSACNCWACFQ